MLATVKHTLDVLVQDVKEKNEAKTVPPGNVAQAAEIEKIPIPVLTTVEEVKAFESNLENDDFMASMVRHVTHF